jgi:methionyl-tRNA synthetase
MDRLMLHEGAAAAFRLVDATNEYIAASEPWALAKSPDQADHLRQVLYDSTEAVRVVATLLLPFMPASASEILQRVGDRRPASAMRFDADAAWQHGARRHVHKAPAMWPRLESSNKAENASLHLTEKSPVTDSQTPSAQPPDAPAATGGSTPLAQATPPAPPLVAPAAAAPLSRITIDDFMKVELRVAKVLTAERLPKSKKLLRLTVDVGTEHRSLVAGIAEAYEPEALIGRTVAMVFNLQPATLMGIESNGMILAASPEGGTAELVAFLNPPPPGTRIR